MTRVGLEKTPSGKKQTLVDPTKKFPAWKRVFFARCLCGLVMLAGIIFSILASQLIVVELPEEELDASVASNPFRTSLLISSATALPIVIELLADAVDIFASMDERPITQWVIRGCLLLCLVVPNFVSFYFNAENIALFFAAVQSFKQVTMWCVAGMFISLHTNVGGRCLCMCTTILAAHVVLYISCLNPGVTSLLVVLEVASSAQLLYMSYRWVRGVIEVFEL
jgi:hypothetical protein